MVRNNPKLGFLDFLERSSQEMVWNEITYVPLTFWKNYMPGKNLVLKFWPEMLYGNQISVFFNRQYLINWLTSYFDFSHVERQE